jgi:hypothetical protein
MNNEAKVLALYIGLLLLESLSLLVAAVMGDYMVTLREIINKSIPKRPNLALIVI